LKATYLTRLLGVNNLPNREIVWAMEKSEDLSSEYEKGVILMAVDSTRLEDQDVRNAFFKVIDGMESDYSKGEILKSLASAGRRNDDLREDCLRAIEGISSEYEYDEVMREFR